MLDLFLISSLLMVFKLNKETEKRWRRLDGKNQLPNVISGVKFNNGCEVIPNDTRHAA
nr:hypothetical protein [Candidatus Paracaedibacter symbiosus]